MNTEIIDLAEIPKNPGPVWTEAQELAMALRDRTVLVSAAAGSGKTATMTEKIIRMIKGDATHEPMDLNRILVVTFTRSAAADLKHKISTALSEALAADPKNTHLRNQFLSLSSAHISTIDSFYNEPVKQNFEALGIPASFRHADDAEIEPIGENVMNAIIEEYCAKYRKNIENHDYSPYFLRFIGSVVGSRDMSSLVNTLRSIYKCLTSLPDGIERLNTCGQKFEAEKDKSFLDSSYGLLLRYSIRDTAQKCADIFEQIINGMNRDSNRYQKAIEFMSNNLEAVRNVQDHAMTDSYRQLHERINQTDFGTLRCMPKAVLPEDEDYKQLRIKAINLFKDKIKKYFPSSKTDDDGDLSEAMETCYMLYGILKDYEKRFFDEKLSRGIFGFDDMSRFMLRLTEDKDGNPTEAAVNYASQFDAVFIDEYQDVNEIQDSIFKALGFSYVDDGNNGKIKKDHRFMVGDIKQSIYSFRYAEPGKFAEYRKAYKEAFDEATAAPDGCSILMSENFRCDENIINFVNLVCGYTFSSCADSIGYTKQDDLVFAKKKPFDKYISPKVCITTVKADKKDRESEATAVAGKIQSLIGHEKLANEQIITASDITVLVRKAKQAKPLIEQLKKLKINAVFVGENTLLTSAQMNMIVNLLDVIDNSSSDIPLSELLVADSTDFGFTFEDIVSVRRPIGDENFNAVSLYSSIERKAADRDKLGDKCRRFVGIIEKYRSLSVKLPIDRFLREMSLDTNLKNLTDTDEFTAVYDCACNYVKNAWCGLYGFMKYFRRYIKSSQISSTDTGIQPNAVNIMTMHKSKGLQFPVCVLYGCGETFLKSDSSPIKFNKDIGTVVKIFNPETGNKGMNLVSALIEDRNSRLGVEEEMRILYVAMTRAKERLIISARLDTDLDTALAEYSTMRDSDLLNVNSYIGWILGAVDNNDSDSFDLYYNRQKYGQKSDTTVSVTEPYPDIPDNNPQSDAITKKNPDNPDSGKSAKYYSDLSCRADKITENSSLLASIPAKAAASLVNDNLLSGCIVKADMQDTGDSDNPDFLIADNEESIRRRIELMNSQTRNEFEYKLSLSEKPTAAEKGSAAHLFLQYCDYKNAAESGIQREIERLLNDGFIDSRTAQILPVDMLEKFFSSNLFELITNASEIRRELKFNMFIPLKEFCKSNESLRLLVGDRTLYVRGSIDLLIKEKSGDFILCDYKTDSVSHEERENTELFRKRMRISHGDQLMQYKRAVYNIFGKEPTRTMIYSLPLGTAVDID